MVLVTRKVINYNHYGIENFFVFSDRNFALFSVSGNGTPYL